jgi:hypothetical protein
MRHGGCQFVITAPSARREGAAMDESGSEARRTSLAVLLRHAENQIRARLQPSLDEAGLSLDHWRILSVLHDCPGLRMTSIAEAAVVPNATLTRHVDLLVERGLIVRRIDADDRRRVVAGALAVPFSVVA